MSRERPPRRIGDVIDASLPASRSALVALGRAWPGLVGATLAAVSFPASLRRDGTLVVHCVDAGWASELQLLERDVRGRLDAALGEAAPARIRFRVGPLPLARVEVSADELVIPADAAASARARTARVRDRELAEAMARALAASTARGAAGGPIGGSADGLR